MQNLGRVAREPRTSIIMPVYRTEASLLRALDSVLNQTDQDFELIIVNDASPDDSDQLIRSRLEELGDERISYLVNEQNMGLAATRNVGLEIARGRWLAYLDSDDAYHPTFLETMHRAATNEVDVVVCSHTLLTPEGQSSLRTRSHSGLLSGQQALLALMTDRMTPYAWDKIFRRSSLGDFRFPLVNRTEDAGYSLAVFQASRRVRVIPDYLVLYTVNPQSITWGSVPPLEQMQKFNDYIQQLLGPTTDKLMTRARSTFQVLTFLNGAQSALRLQPEGLKNYLQTCRSAISWTMLAHTLSTRPIYGLAASLLKLSPGLYSLLYGAYVRRVYGLDR